MRENADTLDTFHAVELYLFSLLLSGSDEESNFISSIVLDDLQNAWVLG